jgi:hypothetical protein
MLPYFVHILYLILYPLYHIHSLYIILLLRHSICFILYDMLHILIREKVKVKFRCGTVQHYSRTGLLYPDPKEVPSFIFRGAAHQGARATSASEGRNYRWNLANNPVIHVNC